jgi:hypothetical protein
MPYKGIIAVCAKTDSKVTSGKNAQFLIPEKVVDIVTTLIGILKEIPEIMRKIIGRLVPVWHSVTGRNPLICSQNKWHF